ncbi:MmcQ/YjbR family DNA-binding protein [Rhodobacter sp. Har01]|uniref:MmcQ/YjbR family DNA-binding protein n=1 Tax=Rhodobacter sp. Har01 TaxID=2883999 RepID=UPI001D06A183|nr:MmcQ/YjbR family DNA-binding protein [Rhodobacter sp. Har01]MCB6179122.1 MmcQ/YjbR family DNA-binding protein [Rhodobacter sp. Har01]
MIRDWPTLKAFALALDLPEVALAHPWGHEALKAHGKMWVWWSPFEDAAVFRADRDEREMLMQADPDTFFLHPHYASHALVLVCAGRIDPAWVRPRLIRDWRNAAPKRWLKTWDAAHPAA